MWPTAVLASALVRPVVVLTTAVPGRYGGGGDWGGEGGGGGGDWGGEGGGSGGGGGGNGGDGAFRVHAVVSAWSRLPELFCSAPTWSHVKPRHAYVDSNAALTAKKLGYTPASNRPLRMLALIVAAAPGLQ
jgi:hypothetical protein